MVHLVNIFPNTAGGAQWRTLTLFELLSEQTEVKIWTEGPINPWFLGKYPINAITPTHYPKGGNLVFIGAYYGVGGFARHANPKRIILLFNSPAVEDLKYFLDGFAKIGRTDVEVAFASEGIRAQTGMLDRPIHVSPISRERFQPRPNRTDTFTVGRMGRNDWSKTHPEDAAFFSRLLDAGCRVRLMGCDASKWMTQPHPNLDLLEPNDEPPEDFLNTLHAFHYRGHPDWYETFGRVNLEAMSCGVPVVAEDRHGYTDYLKHGYGCLLYGDQDDGYAALMSLRQDAKLWEVQSGLALDAAERALDPAVVQEVLDFYMRD